MTLFQRVLGWSQEPKPNVQALNEITFIAKDKIVPFVRRHQIVSVEPFGVSVSLPAGSSRYTFLREAQELYRERSGNPLVSGELLRKLSGSSSCTAILEKDETIAVWGNVPETAGQTRENQLAWFKRNPRIGGRLAVPAKIEDVVVAYAANMMLIQKSILGIFEKKSDLGFTARTAESAIRFKRDPKDSATLGLCESGILDSDNHPSIVFAARLL